MKKQRFFMLGIITVLVAVLSLTFVSSTFAKYTSTISGSDQARVAYWGINNGVTELTIDLFDKSYGDTVKSNGDDNVIAPGTAKEFEVQFVQADATKNEVSYKLTVKATGSVDPAIAANSNIKWTFDGVECTDFEDLLAKINGLSDTYAPGESATVKAKIGWSWAYSVDVAGDEADTAMGNSATDLKAILNISVEATQID